MNVHTRPRRGISRGGIVIVCAIAAAAGLAGCATSTPALSGDAQAQATACRGPATVTEPEKQVRQIRGTAVTADGGPVPGVRVVVTDKEHPDRVYAASTDTAGRFGLEGVPAGAYTLKTCLEGFDTLEMPVTVSRGASPGRLVLTIRLSK